MRPWTFILALSLAAGTSAGCCLEIVGGESLRSSSTGSINQGDCTIDGQTYPNRALNPSNLAECCNASTSPNAWLPIFALSAMVPLSNGGNDEVSADFDNDGRDDVAIADGANNVQVFFSEGNDEWSSPTMIPIGVPFLRPVAGDINGDGLMDIVVGSGMQGGSNSVFVALNQGNHQFASPLAFAAPSGCRIDPVRVGDYDGDGWPDVVAGLARYNLPCASGQVGLYRNLALGSGQLAEPTFLESFGTYTGDVRLGDFNDDGALDIAVSDYDNTVAFYLNGGKGSFGVPTLNSSFTPAPFSPYDLLAAPFTGPAYGVAVSSGANPIVAFVGIGGGSLTSVAATYAVDATYGIPTPVASVIDVNGDGRLDALFANGGTISLLINQPDGSFALASFPSVAAKGGGVQMITVGDLNGDGAPDLAVIQGTSNWSAWLNSCPP